MRSDPYRQVSEINGEDAKVKGWAGKSDFHPNPRKSERYRDQTMKAEQFAYWLQGFSEIHRDAPTAAQWQVIRDHLAEVFEKRTPDRDSIDGQEQPSDVAGQINFEVRRNLDLARQYPNASQFRDRLIC